MFTYFSHACTAFPPDIFFRISSQQRNQGVCFQRKQAALPLSICHPHHFVLPLELLFMLICAIAENSRCSCRAFTYVSKRALMSLTDRHNIALYILCSDLSLNMHTTFSG